MEDSTEVVSINQLLHTYFDGIYEGSIEKLNAVHHPCTVLFGDMKGQPYARTLVLYLNGVAHRPSPRDSGKPFKGEMIGINVVNSIAIAKVRVRIIENQPTMENGEKNIHAPTFLEFMPVSIFGAVMGLTALSFAWRLADHIWHIGGPPAEVIGWTAILVFILTIVYTVKWIRHPALVKTEFKNSETIGFFATVTISIMLISGILLPYAP